MHSIYHDTDIKASASTIFEAISSASGLESWWTKKSESNPVLGGTYRFYFDPEYDWYAKVIQIQTDKSIVYEMTASTDDWLGTRLNFELISIDDTMIRLRFEHLGWRELSDHFRRSSYCWALYLKGLKDYCENSTPPSA